MSSSSSLIIDDAAVQKLRHETHILRNSSPSQSINHLNNAGAALMPAPVENALINYTRRENSIGSYECQNDHKKQLDQVYLDVGRLINAQDPLVEIALQESATVAWCNAFYSIKFQKGDVILTGKQEYGANYVAMLQVAKRFGVEIKVIPSEDCGVVDVNALSEMLKQDSLHVEKRTGHKKVRTEDDVDTTRRRCKNIRLVAITHIPTNSGLVNPCEEIGDIVSQYSNVFYLVDACQSAGQMPLDVQKLQCHFLSATSRKYLRGPRGCGFLYVRRELLLPPSSLKHHQVSHYSALKDCFGEPPTIDHFAAPWISTEKYQLKETARRYEKWEHSPCLRLAMGEAIRYALDVVPGGLHGIWQRIQFLANDLRLKLRELYFKTGKTEMELCDIGNEKNLCGLVTFRLKSYPNCLEAKEKLRRTFSINVVVSTLNVTRLDMSERNLPTCLRASVHYYNTVEENDQLVKALEVLIEEGKKNNKTHHQSKL